MDLPNSEFEIIEIEGQCPLYRKGDLLRLGGRTLCFPRGEYTCLILTGVIIEALNLLQQPGLDDFELNCGGTTSGCTGLVRIAYHPEITASNGQEASAAHSAISNILKKFSIFQNMSQREIEELVPLLKMKSYRSGEVIIKKGDPGVNLFIIISGKIEVLGDNDAHIAYLGQGDVFGEMSLLSGQPVGTTIAVASPSKLLSLKGSDFRKVMNRFPSLQMYFTQLLAARLTKSNIQQAQEYASGMSGKLSEVPPSELFQVLNMNNKTGNLVMEIKADIGEIDFCEGRLIRAGFKGLNGEDAFFELLRAREGRFKFTPQPLPEDVPTEDLGDFMWLLMEGLNRIDEDE